MRRTLSFTPAEVMPAAGAVLAAQGIPAGATVAARTLGLLGAATERFAAHAVPRAVVQDIEVAELAEVYHGDDLDLAATPLAALLPQAEAFALFALTLGQEVSEEIPELFRGGDLALGAMLDSLASEAAEAMVALLERRLAAELDAAGRVAPDTALLAYSPGYCGWPVTGQRRLFAALAPEEIGITLTPSCLMQPLKSVSGVVVAGPARLHLFDPTFDCCLTCTTRTCRGRMARVRREVADGDPGEHRHQPAER